MQQVSFFRTLGHVTVVYYRIVDEHGVEYPLPRNVRPEPVVLIRESSIHRNLWCKKRPKAH